MRLFVAVYPPQETLDHLEAAVGRLRVGAAAAAGATLGLAERARWHVTLVFLGEVPDSRTAAATEALQGAVARWRTVDNATPAVRLTAGGRFRRGMLRRDRSTVLWVGLAGDLASLQRLVGNVRRSLRRARLPYDRKPFRPHLTVARPRGRVPAEDITADLATLASYQGPEWLVADLRLVRSQLGPKPVHEILATVPLA